jgi:hypothetical protein
MKQSLKMMAETNTTFQKACKIANCNPTKRQASKFRNGKGIAWKVGKGLAEPLTDPKQGAAG